MTEKSSRSELIDFSRGIVVFLMLWGHCIQCMCPAGLDYLENPVFKTIYSFHMPCFALISGYLLWHSFDKADIYAPLGKRILALAKPIVFAHFFNACLNFLPKFILQFSTETCVQFVKSLASISWLWFFWSILASAIAIACAKTMSQKIHVQLIYIVLLLPFVCALPVGGQNVFIYFYVVVGYYFARLRTRISDRLIGIVGCVTIPVFLAMRFFYEKKHYIYETGMYSSQYSLSENISIDLFRYAIGLVGSIAFVFVLSLVKKLLDRVSPAKNRLSLEISSGGGKSLQIYALSMSLLNVYLSRVSSVVYVRFPAIEMFFSNHLEAYSLLVTPVVAVVYFIVLYAIIRQLEKLGVSKYIYGR